MAEKQMPPELLLMLQALGGKLKRSGHPIDMENLEERTGKVWAQQISLPNKEFNGFSSNQMDQLLNHPFEKDCPVQLRHLTDQEILRIPFMRQALHLMETLSQKEIKLTSKGNLPTKIVSELYELGTHNVNSDYYLQKTEDRIPEVYALRGIITDLGLIKAYSGKLSLTAYGKKLLGNHNALLRTIITFFFTDYQIGWYDMETASLVGIIGRLYSLWLLHHFGVQWRKDGYYSEDFSKLTLYSSTRTVFLSAEDLYKFRIFYIMFNHLDICEIKESPYNPYEKTKVEVRKTPLLEMMFSFTEPVQM